MRFLLRHWNGELPLLTSALAVGLLGLAIVAAAFRLIVFALTLFEPSLVVVAVIELAWFALCLALWVWGAVGIWRAAGHVEARTRWICRGGLALVTVALLPNGVGSVQSAREHVLIAAGLDPLGLPANVQVRADKL